MQYMHRKITEKVNCLSNVKFCLELNFDYFLDFFPIGVGDLPNIFFPYNDNIHTYIVYLLLQIFTTTVTRKHAFQAILVLKIYLVKLVSYLGPCLDPSSYYLLISCLYMHVLRSI